MTALLRLAARAADALLGRPRVDLAQRLAAYTYAPASPPPPSAGDAGVTT